MGNDTAYGILVVAFVAAVLAWVYWPDKPKVVERHTVTSPIVSSPLTPLQAKRAKRTSAARSPDSRGSGASAQNHKPLGAVANPGLRRDSRPVAQSPTRTGTKRRATTGTPKRPTGAQGQPSSTPPPSPQPQQQPHPQPGVTVPLPSVCLPPITCP